MKKISEDIFVVTVSFILNFISVGIAQSFGILYTELVYYFEASRSETSWIASLGLGLMLMFGPCAGIIEGKYGCSIITIIGSALVGIGLLASSFAESLYLLYLTYGVITGIGFSLCHVAANDSVNVHFNKRRAMAAGLSSTGCAVGTIVFPIICINLIEEYMWQGTFLLMAGIGLQGMYCGFMLRNARHSHGKEYQNSSTIDERKTLAKGVALKLVNEDIDTYENREDMHRPNLWTKTKDIFKNPQFVVFILSGICVSLAFFVPFVMLQDMLIEHGMKKNKAALMITTTGIASIISRVVFGFLSDSPRLDKLVVNGIALVILGTGTSLICVFEDEYLFFFYSSLLGIVTGVFGMYRSVVVVDIIGRIHLSLAYGYLIFFDGVAIMIGPPLAGILYDVTNSFKLSFISADFMFLIGGLLSIFAKSSCSRNKLKKDDYK